MALEDTAGYSYDGLGPFTDYTAGVGYSGGAAVSGGGGFFDNLGKVVTQGLGKWIDVESTIRIAQAGQPAVLPSNQTTAAGGTGQYVQVPKPSNDTLLIVAAIVVAVIVFKS